MRTVKALSSGLPPVFTIPVSTVARAVHTRIAAAPITVAASGEEYAVGDELTLDDTGITGEGGSTITAAKVTVTKVSPNGTIQEVALLQKGDYLIADGTHFGVEFTGGSGAGDDIHLTFSTESYAVVTVTASRPHRLTAGQRVTVGVATTETLAKQRLYNGTYTVGVTSGTVFTYEHTDTATTALASAVSLTAQALLPSIQYDPFVAIRANRLQVEDAVPDYSLHVDALYRYTVGAAVTVVAAGSGYVVDEVLTVNGGTTGTGGSAATIKVTAVAAVTGAITGAVILAAGAYSVAPTSPNAADAAQDTASDGQATFTLPTISRAHAGNWREILALEATVVNALTSTTLNEFKDGMLIPAGARIKGAFSTISLTSGSVLLSE